MREVVAVEPSENPSAADRRRAVEHAESEAASARTLEQLRVAIEGFEYCRLNDNANRTVFGCGNPDSGLMIVGEAPGEEENLVGCPFFGRAGKSLNSMLREIGIDRYTDAYITNAIPWRPPKNRNPRAHEINVMRPFLLRHVRMVAPTVVVALGKFACSALLCGTGILRTTIRDLREECRQNEEYPHVVEINPGISVIPTYHPSYWNRCPGGRDLVRRDMEVARDMCRENNA